jgi:hypothetical protein
VSKFLQNRAITPTGLSRILFSAFIIFVAAALGMAAVRPVVRKRQPKPHVGNFQPVCSLPFSGVRNSAIDSQCGISGGSTDPAKKAESIAKNNFCAANTSPLQMSYDQWVNLQNRSATLPKNTPSRQAMRTLGEGRFVSYIAFISQAYYSDVSAGEAVNCNIPGSSTNDIHIVLLQNLSDDECQSTTAEMSPHYRPRNWTPEKLNATRGHPVRIQGQLFFDGSHTPCHGSSRPNPKRISLWEIHPVYSVEVCSDRTIAKCRSKAAHWTLIK